MVFIVAEIGVNWEGDFEILVDMIKNSKSAGCDAVKLQCFQKNTVKNHLKSLTLMKSTISDTNIEMVNDLAKKNQIEWFCTPMYPQAVTLLEPYVKRYKMRFIDGNYLIENQKSDLFNAILKTDKEIMISCQKSPKNSKYFNNPKIHWLYCVPKYPCKISDLDFSNLSDFTGYSNHCPLIAAPLTAAILGAEIIEIHITSDKTRDFIDNSVSFDYNELNELVRLIRVTEKIKK